MPYIARALKRRAKKEEDYKAPHVCRLSPAHMVREGVKGLMGHVGGKYVRFVGMYGVMQLMTTVPSVEDGGYT